MTRLLQGVEDLLEALSNPGVQNGFELLPPRGLPKHDRGHLAAVEFAALVDHIGAKRSDDLGQTLAAVRHDHARQSVRGDHGNPEVFEELRDTGLAAADATRESVHVHSAQTRAQPRVGARVRRPRCSCIVRRRGATT